MSYGFQVYDSSGNLVLDVSDRLSRIIYWSAQSSGSAVLPSFHATRGCFGYINRGGGIVATEMTWSASTSTLTWSSNIAGAAFVLMVR